jgi:hypothetical protein
MPLPSGPADTIDALMIYTEYNKISPTAGSDMLLDTYGILYEIIPSIGNEIEFADFYGYAVVKNSWDRFVSPTGSTHTGGATVGPFNYDLAFSPGLVMYPTLEGLGPSMNAEVIWTGGTLNSALPGMTTWNFQVQYDQLGNNNWTAMFSGGVTGSSTFNMPGDSYIINGIDPSTRFRYWHSFSSAPGSDDYWITDAPGIYISNISSLDGKTILNPTPANRQMWMINGWQNAGVDQTVITIALV